MIPLRADGVQFLLGHNHVAGGGLQDFWLGSEGLLRATEAGKARKNSHLLKRQCRIKMMANSRFHAREGKRSEALRLETAKVASDERLEPKLRILQCFGGTSGAHLYTLLG